MVEWKELKEVFDTRNGYTPSTSNETFWEGGYIPWFKMEDIRDNGGILNDSYLHITDKAIKGKGLFKANSILLATSATIGEHALIEVEHLSNQRFTNLYPKAKYEHEINMRYAYYYMFIIDEWCRQHVNKGGFASVDMSGLYKQPFPIPSLSEQQRIVGILDTFTSSIENLKEQIALRRKQYEYFRDQLLDLEGKEGTERVLLKDVCEVINGRAYSQPELLNEGKYRVLRVGNFFSNDSWYYSDLELESRYYCQKGDLLYAWSASFGPHIWEEEKVIYHYHIWKMDCSNGLHKKFMYYWLQSEDMKRQAFTNLHGATMAHLTKALMEALMVPLPSLSEQQRIVSILDTFEASIANLEEQLKQREKQYEYYRNKLLTFE